MEGLEVRDRSTFLPISTYRAYLRQHQKFYWAHFKPSIVSDITKSKLLDFIRTEFAPFLREDRILSASLFLQGGFANGFPLEDLLEQLLKIAIMKGIDQAISNFDRSTTERQGSFQYMTLLEGIKLNREIQVFDGIRLVPLPNSTSEFPRYLPDLSFHSSGTSQSSLLGKIVLIINYSVSPIFHKPFLATTIQEYEEQRGRTFHVEINSRDVRSFNQTDFSVELFCQALSFACNSGVQSALQWEFLAADELFNLSSGFGTSTAWIPGPFGSSVEVGEDQINEAKHLYKKLTNLDPDVKEKLRIPIDRWIQSKADRDPVDQMIDLGIAFEALYVPDGGGDLTYKFSIRAARHLGKDKEHRQELLKKFGQIYGCRSEAVHSGKLDKPPKFGKGRIPVSDFIDRAQDLCRESIIKILEDGNIPDWDSLLLGGEDEQASS